MLKVMLDNWEISSLAFMKMDSQDLQNLGIYFRMRDDEKQENWQKFLSSIVLWDELYFNMMDFFSASLFWNTSVYIKKLIHEKKISFIHSLNYTEICEKSSDIERTVYSLLKRADEKAEIDKNHINLFELERCIGYYCVAQALGYTYIADTSREKTLNALFIRNNSFDPTLFMDMIDDRVQDFINNTNELCKRDILSFQAPALYKYIKKRAIGPDEELEYAVELHNNKDVVYYRKSISKINDNIRKGNLLDANVAIQETNNICDELTNSMYKKQLKYQVNIGVSPSLSIGGTSKAKIKGILHTTFLRDVAFAGFHGND